ncbi:hypothetical protein EDD86DRAFT_16369 [Gorgonomyces haynaldii]|nr:hypothetical protein EDD86DRAFT_16369 [Gorgonomyces haynaldii]
MTLKEHKFFFSPTFKLWALTTGICTVTDAVINLLAAFFFLKHIASVMNISAFKMVAAIMVKHEGMRWIALIILNIFFVIAMIWGAFVDSTSSIVVLSYHASPFGMFLALYTFLESSYVAARDLIEEHSIAKKSLQLTTRGDHVKKSTTAQTLRTTSGPLE